MHRTVFAALLLMCVFVLCLSFCGCARDANEGGDDVGVTPPGETIPAPPEATDDVAVDEETAPEPAVPEKTTEAEQDAGEADASAKAARPRPDRTESESPRESHTPKEPPQAQKTTAAPNCSADVAGQFGANAATDAKPQRRDKAEDQSSNGTHDQPSDKAPENTKATVVVGSIKIASQVPDPSEVPYDTCVSFVKYGVQSVESGQYDGDELLAVFWGMKDGELMPASRFAEGQRHRLRIQPFSQRPELTRVMQADDTGEYALTPYWVISYESI